MAQLKAHEVEQYITKPKADHHLFLVYGPDAGLVSERATNLAKNIGVVLDDPFSTIKLDADVAASDPQKIADEAFTVSMFGDKRLIWIKGSTQRNLIGALQPVIDNPPSDCIIVIEAGDLKKSSPLRNRIEKARAALTMPCYPDQGKSITAVIDDHITSAGLKIDADARQLLLTQLGGDRLATRAELEKLCIYASGAESISIKDVASIVGDASNLDIHTVVDAASIGDVATMEHMLKRLFARGTPVFTVVSAIQRHFQTLHQMKCQMLHSSQPPTSVVGTIRPPVNFQRRDKIILALSIWRPTALERALRRLDQLSLESRKNARLAISLTSTALLAIAIEASKNNKTR